MSSLFLVGDTMPEDLVLGAVAAREAGVPETVIWQWAARKKIARFPGNWNKHGRGSKTMYSLKQVMAMAEKYKAMPQRRPRGRLAA